MKRKEGDGDKGEEMAKEMEKEGRVDGQRGEEEEIGEEEMMKDYVEKREKEDPSPAKALPVPGWIDKWR